MEAQRLEPQAFHVTAMRKSHLQLGSDVSNGDLMPNGDLKSNGDLMFMICFYWRYL